KIIERLSPAKTSEMANRAGRDGQKRAAEANEILEFDRLINQESAKTGDRRAGWRWGLLLRCLALHVVEKMLYWRLNRLHPKPNALAVADTPNRAQQRRSGTVDPRDT